MYGYTKFNYYHIYKKINIRINEKEIVGVDDGKNVNML